MSGAPVSILTINIKNKVITSLDQGVCVKALHRLDNYIGYSLLFITLENFCTH